LGLLFSFTRLREALKIEGFMGWGGRSRRPVRSSPGSEHEPTFRWQGRRRAGRRQRALDRLAHRPGAACSRGASCRPCDLTADDQVDRFFGHVAQEFGGRLDFLVHSVAFAQREDLTGRFVNTSREGFRLALDVSVYTLMASARRALPLLRAGGGGSILTLSFFGAEKVVPNYNVMGVAKAALEASVRYLANDLGPDNIRVNAVSAGAIKTLSSRAIGQFGDMIAVAAGRSPLRRNTEPEEVADAAAFLLSDAARGVTGEVLHVDCGYNIMGF
jgi:enoyl-[acyl-carrier protein] reductase I